MASHQLFVVLIRVAKLRSFWRRFGFKLKYQTPAQWLDFLQSGQEKVHCGTCAGGVAWR